MEARLNIHVGQQVVCISNGFHSSPNEYWRSAITTFPELCGIYAVREVREADGLTGICLGEIVNPRVYFRRWSGNVFVEPAFDIKYFRPAKKTSSDLFATLWCRLIGSVRKIRAACRPYNNDHARSVRRGINLLIDNLTAEQQRQYETSRCFEVIGGKSHKRYRIFYGTEQNVHELDASGRAACTWCFYPSGGLVVGDVMLAQKTALELFESNARELAHMFPIR
jgi:hypothetical protein